MQGYTGKPVYEAKLRKQGRSVHSETKQKSMDDVYLYVTEAWEARREEVQTSKIDYALKRARCEARSMVASEVMIRM